MQWLAELVERERLHVPLDVGRALRRVALRERAQLRRRHGEGPGAKGEVLQRHRRLAVADRDRLDLHGRAEAVSARAAAEAYTGAHQYFRVYVDTDRAASTGLRIGEAIARVRLKLQRLGILLLTAGTFQVDNHLACSGERPPRRFEQRVCAVSPELVVAPAPTLARAGLDPQLEALVLGLRPERALDETAQLREVDRRELDVHAPRLDLG